MLITAVLGAVFLGFEVNEFTGLVAQGAGPDRSAFLSSFFTLVGCHGLHVTLGELWLLTMMAQVFAKGYRPDILRRILCFGLFVNHALDNRAQSVAVALIQGRQGGFVALGNRTHDRFIGRRPEAIGLKSWRDHAS